MATKIRIELNTAEVRSLLTSPEVQADIARRCAAIAAAANTNRFGGVFGHDVVVGKSRAHGMVWTDDPDAMLAEAVDRSLTRAIDAGRI